MNAAATVTLPPDTPTPGEWAISPSTYRSHVGEVFHLESTDEKGRYTLIAYVLDHMRWVDGCDDPQTSPANALLLREAPALLRLLRSALTIVEAAKFPGPAMSDPWTVSPLAKEIRESLARVDAGLMPPQK